MMTTHRFQIVLVTAPDLKTARLLAREALRHRVAACANLIHKVESHYWWKGRLESAAEVLVIFKTAGRHLKKLEQLVLKLHPYDTPEFLALSIKAGNKRYLDWLGQSTAAKG